MANAIQKMSNGQTEAKPLRLPEWLRVKVHVGRKRDFVNHQIDDLRLNTVCQSAKCPNLAECWHRGTATFMILGNRCTRNCVFCAIDAFKPEALDAEEPERVAEAAYRMQLSYVVITSVTRDDIPDKGAQHFVQTIRAVRKRLPSAGIEILTPDFKGRRHLVEQVLGEKPTVFNHNMETCARLTTVIRSGGRYERSLSVLKMAKELTDGTMATKSGFMVGLGENDDEIEEMMEDMLAVGVDILTIGQYLPPSRKHWPVQRYVKPEQFKIWTQQALKMGFKAVASAPMVRSSYHSETMATQALDALAL